MVEAGADIRVLPFGDAAVLVDLGDTNSRSTAMPGAHGAGPRGQQAPGSPEWTRALLDLAAHLHDSLRDRPGWGRPVPGASTLLVPVDPLEPGVEAAVGAVAALVAGWRQAAEEIAEPAEETAEPIIDIPVRYGGVDGPDLDEVAERCRLSPAGVVERHAGVVYTAAFMGFAPGFAYLGPLHPDLVIARRPMPRSRVPTRSVAIGGPHTGVYAVESPGGWWLIGRTATSLWDVERDPPTLLHPGARLRFVPAPTQ